MVCDSVCEMRNAQQGCGFGIFSENFALRGNSDNYGGGYGNGNAQYELPTFPDVMS